MEWLFRSLVFWIVTVPILTLLHELAHAFGGLVTSPGKVTVSLGSSRPAYQVHAGRLSIRLRAFSGIVGFCSREHQATSWRGEVVFYALGPLASLALGGVCFLLVRANVPGEQFFWSAMSGALMQCLFTSIPMVYPSWLGAYSGYRSDGAAILACIRTRKPVGRK